MLLGLLGLVPSIAQIFTKKSSPVVAAPVQPPAVVAPPPAPVAAGSDFLKNPLVIFGAIGAFFMMIVLFMFATSNRK